jgi:hypothetical protein
MRRTTRRVGSRVWIAAGAVTCVLSQVPSVQARELSFEDRVEAQRAIEHVHYSHQLGATKPFEQALPTELLESKVRRYLAQSQALEEVRARAMRNLLVDHARRRGRAKRGGVALRLTLDEGLLAGGGSPEELIALARGVELHYFRGLTYEEIAEALGVSLATICVDMRFSRAWLRAALGGD